MTRAGCSAERNQALPKSLTGTVMAPAEPREERIHGHVSRNAVSRHGVVIDASY